MNQRNKMPSSNDLLQKSDQQEVINALAAALLAAYQNQDGQAGAARRPSTLMKQSGRGIDLIELFYYVLSKIFFVILAAIVCGAYMGHQAGKTVPIYTATSKLYIVNPQGTSLNIADLQMSNMLSPDYQEIFKTWEIHEMVRSELNLNYSYAQLQSMLSINIPEDTRVLYISIRSPIAEEATEIANAYAQAAKTFILQTMSTDEPNIFSVALIPSVAYTVNSSYSVIRGILLGSVAAVAIIVLFFILDDRPRTPEHIAAAADIPTLALIPVASKKTSKRFRKKSKEAGYESR